MSDIDKIIIEGYEDTFRDYEDGPEADHIIVTYDMNTKEQAAIEYAGSDIECEGNGGELDFDYSPDIKDLPDDYFAKKRKHPLFNNYLRMISL